MAYTAEVRAPRCAPRGRRGRANAPVQSAREATITIHDLLRHTSASPMGGRGATPCTRCFPPRRHPRPPSTREGIHRAALPRSTCDQPAARGIRFSIDVLGLIIEAETGRTLAPTSTIASGTRSAWWTRASSYRRRGRSATRGRWPNDRTRASHRLFRTGPRRTSSSAAAAAPCRRPPITCLRQMLLNRGKLGKTRVLPGSTVDYMTSNQLERGMQNTIELADPTKAGFDFGLNHAVRTSAGGPGSWASGRLHWVGRNRPISGLAQGAARRRVHVRGPVRSGWHYRG